MNLAQILAALAELAPEKLDGDDEDTKLMMLVRTFAQTAAMGDTVHEFFFKPGSQDIFIAYDVFYQIKFDVHLQGDEIKELLDMGFKYHINNRTLSKMEKSICFEWGEASTPVPKAAPVLPLTQKAAPVLPLTPTEVEEYTFATIPPEVFKVVNLLLLEKGLESSIIMFSASEFTEALLEEMGGDVVPPVCWRFPATYRKAGWKVCTNGHRTHEALSYTFSK